MKGRNPKSGSSRAKRAGHGGFEYHRHPLSSVDPDALKAALLEMAQNSADAFEGHRDAILSVFRRAYPPHIIATLAGWGLFAGVSDGGVAARSMIPDFQQHHAELLQALALSMPAAEWGMEPAEPSDIQTALNEVMALTTAFHRRRFLALSEVEDLQQRTVRSLQEKIRLHTQMVRNWGYFSHVVDISSELYTPLDGVFRGPLGFGASDLIAVARSLVSTLERRNGGRFQILKRIFRERRIPRLVRQFFALFPGAEGDPEAFIKQVPNWATVDDVKFRLLNMADIALVSNAVFRASEVANDTGLAEPIVRAVLDTLAYREGGLVGSDVDHLFLNNPVWTRPLVATGGHYFCVAPQVVFSFIHEIMRQLAERAGAKKALEKRRSSYLEEKLCSLVTCALPVTKIENNVRWKDGDTVYETDLFAQVDQTILIAEAKSHALTPAGLRGAPDRVRRHVQELVVDPSKQSGRLETLIASARKGDAYALEVLAPFKTDWGNVRSVMRVSVTLDDFSILASSEIELRQAGWIPDGVYLAPTLNMADFGVVLDLLSEPAFILHYLVERERIQKAIDIFADELDFLGYYLETGFNVWGVEQSGSRLSISGMSQAVDHYYTSLDAGVPVPKPRPKLRPFLREIVAVLQTRARPGWVELAFGLLRVGDYEDQAKIERYVKRLKANVERNWRDPDHECSVMITPPASRNLPVVFYVYPPRLAASRRDTAGVLAAKAIENTGRPSCIIVGKPTEPWDQPYSFVYLCGDDAPAEAA